MTTRIKFQGVSNHREFEGTLNIYGNEPIKIELSPEQITGEIDGKPIRARITIEIEKAE